MRSVRSIVSAAFLCLMLLPTANPQTGPRSGVWKTIAPNVQVMFSQLSGNSCTWTFRNVDTVHTLADMRFSYTYSTAIISRSPASGPATPTGSDVLVSPLAPFEESGGDQNYRILANCATVNIHVTSTKWI